MNIFEPFKALFRWFQGKPKTHGYDGFIYERQTLSIRSSNVNSARYFYETKQLQITYHNGQSWVYSQIDPREALDFAQAGSKGSWVWANLRSRGTKHGQQKPAQRLR